MNLAIFDAFGFISILSKNKIGERVAVYHEGTTYSGTYEINGLDDYKNVTVGTQQKWLKDS